MTFELPDHLARRIRTAALLLVDLTEHVPSAPVTVFGIVASLGSGSPEAQFPADNGILLSFLAGELAGIAAGLGEPLPLLLVAAGVENGVAADEESMVNALAMARSATRSDERANEM